MILYKLQNFNVSCFVVNRGADPEGGKLMISPIIWLPLYELTSSCNNREEVTKQPEYLQIDNS